MKRFLIAVFITLTLVVVNIWVMLHLIDNSTRFLGAIPDIQAAIHAKDENLAEKLDAFSKDWYEMEHTMSRYIRHNHLEAITSVVARMPSLAQHKAYYELDADLEQVRVLLQHLVEFETPAFLNHIMQFIDSFQK